jgi:hypothetical protein
MSEKKIKFSISKGVVDLILNRREDPGYTHIIPSRWFDLARMASIEKEFRKLGIKYGKCDVYPAFETKQDLDEALLRVYNSGWSDNWAIKDYLIDQNLIK